MVLRFGYIYDKLYINYEQVLTINIFMQSFIKSVVWACLVLIPFIALYVSDGKSLDIFNWGTSGMYFPFISGKNLLFRALVEIAFFGWIILLFSDVKYRVSLKKSPLSIAFAVFVVVLFFADIFGVNVTKSIWSNFERMEGLVSIVHFFMYFLVLVATLHTLKEWRTMFKIFVASNIVVLAYAYAQLLGAQGFIFSKIAPSMASWFSTNFPIHQSINRLDATIGNSAYFAIYCLLFAYISALLWSQSHNPKRNRIYIPLIVLNVVGVFYSGTRGTVIGLIVGILVMIALQVFNWIDSKKEIVVLSSATILYALYLGFGLFINNDALQYFSPISYVFAFILLVTNISIFVRFKDKLRKLGALVFIVIVASILLFQGIKTTNFVKNSPTLSRLASISPTEITSASRITIWKMSYNAWLERPILGYGQDNFDYIFARKFIADKLWQLEPWYDRSHDVFFDWLVAGGILGLLSYLSLYVVSLWLMWRKGHDMSLREKAILTGALAGYFVHNIFVFDNLTSYMLFFLLLAYIVVRTKGNVIENSSKKSVINSEYMSLLVLPITGIAFITCFYFVVYAPFQVNRLLSRAMSIGQYAQTMPITQAIKISQDSFTSAIAYNTLGATETREQFLQMAPRLVQMQIPANTPEADKKAFEDSVLSFIKAIRDDIKASHDQYKNDVRMLSIYGLFYNGIGDAISGEAVLKEARVFAPNKQLISCDLIRALLIQNKNEEAYTLSKQVFESAPAYVDAVKWYLLSAVYDKKFNEAQKVVIGNGQEIPLEKNIFGALVSTGQTSVAVQSLLEIKKVKPEYGSQIDAYILELLPK